MLLTIREAARQLAVSPSTVERLLDRGELKRVKIGRSVRVDADELRTFVRRAGGDLDGKPQMISPGQSSAYHAKVGTIARLTQREPRDVKASVMAHASQMFAREIASSTELTYVEASGLLDWLDDQVAQCRSDGSASTAG